MIIGRKSKQAFSWYKHQEREHRHSFHTLVDIIFKILYDDNKSENEKLKDIRDICEEASSWVLPYDTYAVMEKDGIDGLQAEQAKHSGKQAQLLSLRGKL